MQESGWGLVVLVGQAVEAAGARPRRVDISMMLDIEAMTTLSSRLLPHQIRK